MKFIRTFSEKNPLRNREMRKFSSVRDPLCANLGAPQASNHRLEQNYGGECQPISSAYSDISCRVHKWSLKGDIETVFARPKKQKKNETLTDFRRKIDENFGLCLFYFSHFSTKERNICLFMFVR